MRALATYAFACVLVASPTAAPAVTPDPLAPVLDDRIARTLERCLANPKLFRTSDIEACYTTAVRDYSSLLRVVYKSVDEHLDPDSRGTVARSQAAWSAASHATREADRAPWRKGRGTIVGIEVLQNEARAIRDRIVALHLYWPGYSAEEPLSLSAPR